MIGDLENVKILPSKGGLPKLLVASVSRMDTRRFTQQCHFFPRFNAYDLTNRYRFNREARRERVGA